MQLNVLYRAEESLDAFAWIAEQLTARDDELPFAVPDRASDEPVAGELGAEQAARAAVDIRAEHAAG